MAIQFLGDVNPQLNVWVISGTRWITLTANRNNRRVKVRLDQSFDSEAEITTITNNLISTFKSGGMEAVLGQFTLIDPQDDGPAKVFAPRTVNTTARVTSW
jgi:hypothetical protein